VGPLRALHDVEYVTMQWVDRYNNLLTRRSATSRLCAAPAAHKSLLTGRGGGLLPFIGHPLTEYVNGQPTGAFTHAGRANVSVWMGRLRGASWQGSYLTSKVDLVPETGRAAR
jgi:hypothetical protein